MNIVVLNGSPKGERSVTLQYVDYLERRLGASGGGLHVEVINISSRIKKLERDLSAFDEVISKIEGADLVLWATPVYVLLVPAQLVRFIELINERGAQKSFRRRPTAVLTTSIKFFDCTAHDYLRAVCEDLDMVFLDAYSAEMHDLLRPEERERLEVFFTALLDDLSEGRPASARKSPPLPPATAVYSPGEAQAPLSTGGRKTVLIVDTDEPDQNLALMIERSCARLGGDVEVIALERLKIKGGCLGCVRCGLNNQCRWEGKDDFIDFYRDQVMTADLLIFAGSIRGRFLSSAWKRYFDRAFFNTHTPSIEGKQLGVLVSGPLQQQPHMRQFFEGYADWQGADLVDIVTDEPASSSMIDAAIDSLADRMVRLARRGYQPPKTFLGVGGWKIFRDDIWGMLRFVFPADHAAYKARGLYDTFPQKDLESRARNLVMKAVTTFPPSRRDYLKNLTRNIVAPYQKILDAAGPKGGHDGNVSQPVKGSSEGILGEGVLEPGRS